ncbi:hypothetical protein ACSLO3_27905, partial [Escherichia coli]
PNIIEGASSWFDIQAPHEITFNLDGEPLSGQNFHIEILPAAFALSENKDITLVVCGGTVRHKTRSMHGSIAERSLQDINA